MTTSGDASGSSGPEAGPAGAFDLEQALDELYAAAPDHFTAARDALVRRLRPTDRQAADAVKALRRPPVTAWALNQVARTHAEDLAALVEADSGLARAQLQGAGRQALAQAGQSRREIIGRLVEAAEDTLAAAGHAGTPTSRDRLSQTLVAIAVDAEGREALLRGRLTGDLTPGSVWDAGASPGLESVFAAGTLAGTEEAAGVQRRQGLRQKADELAALAKQLEAEAARLDADAARAEANARVARSVANEARRSAEEARRRADAAREDVS